MATLIIGKLKTTEQMDFSGYRVAAAFEQKINLDSETAEFVPARAGAVPAPDGTFQLEIPDKENRLGPIAIAVAGPSGLPAGKHEIPEEGPFENISIDVLPCAPTIVNTSTDLALGSQLKYTGRAIDPTGRGLAANLLVVIWAQNEGAEAATPVSVTRTQEGGYFSAPWPSAQFVAAFAVISGGDPISVSLENNHLPRRLILVAESTPQAGVDKAGCDCRAEPPRAPDQIDLASNPQSFSTDIQRCVNLTVPNRTVEEVSYQAVVRTTQPELKGTMPPRETSVPESFITRLVQLAQQRPTELGVGAPSGAIVQVLPPATTPAALPGPIAGEEDKQKQKFSSAVMASVRTFTPGISLENGTATTAYPSNELAEKILEARVQTNQPLKLETSVLTELAREPGGITSRRLLEAEHTSIVRNFRNTVALMDAPGTARFDLDDQRQLDWDANPDAYQATTIAHGHLLTLKQVWRADGYSLGDLLYSLPLAPGQQKLISTLDWSRTEISTRRAQRQATEDLAADLSHDRDVNDIIRSSLSEHLDANSEASVKAGGFALGGFIGPLIFGGGGGVSSADSTASQTSARSVTGSALNRIRDRTLQSASAVRSQRTSVVQTARQGESVRAQTEVVANNNHCHAVTIEYFEVLRHFQVSQELAYVQECLFIPFGISPFNEQKTMRWREILQSRLRQHELNEAFDALERKVTNWQNADFPLERYADDLVTYIDGDFLIRMNLPRPADDDDGNYVAANWIPYRDYLAATDPKDIWDRYMGVALPANRSAIWDTRIAPGVAQRIIETLTLELLGSGTVPGGVTVDPTLVSRFAQDRPLRVSLRANIPLPAWTRAQIERIRLSLNVTNLPSGAEMLMESASVTYRTDHFTHALFSNHRILNDLTLGDAVEIATPLDLLEKRNPRQRDQRSAKRLIDHLNEHIEYYHRAVWMDMDPNRRYLLLEGFIAPDAGGRSVASVVQNRVIGIVGNCLVMPVAPGQQLDCTYAFADATFEDLRNLYAGDPAPPMRISVPTSGVFAEAVMGECNSCEKIDDTRFWRWEEAPIPDQPSLIAPLSTDTRRTTPPPLTPDQFPEALVRLQETPSAPAPTGLAAAVSALGVGNIFKDLTGLALNQANAAEALKASLKTAQGFATKASALAQQKFLNRELDRGLDNIKAARDQGLITKEQAQERTENLLRGAIGEERPQQTSPTKVPAVQKAMERVPTAKRGSLRVTRPEGTVEVITGQAGGAIDVAINPNISPLQQKSNMTCWAAGGAMMVSWQSQTSIAIKDLLDRLGGDWRKKFDNNEGLTANQIRAFFAALGLVEEGPASYTPEGLARLLASKGPLLEIGDDSIDNNRVVHVRIITAVRGDGTPQGTEVKLADSATGTIVPESFTDFDKRHSSTDPVRFGVGLFHF
jgi:hypothetical protein